MRLTVLSLIAKMLRVRFKVDGIPYGAAFRAHAAPAQISEGVTG